MKLQVVIIRLTHLSKSALSGIRTRASERQRLTIEITKGAKWLQVKFTWKPQFLKLDLPSFDASYKGAIGD